MKVNKMNIPDQLKETRNESTEMAFEHAIEKTESIIETELSSVGFPEFLIMEGGRRFNTNKIINGDGILATEREYLSDNHENTEVNQCKVTLSMDDDDIMNPFSLLIPSMVTKKLGTEHLILPLNKNYKIPILSSILQEFLTDVPFTKSLPTITQLPQKDSLLEFIEALKLGGESKVDSKKNGTRKSTYNQPISRKKIKFENGISLSSSGSSACTIFGVSSCPNLSLVLRKHISDSEISDLALRRSPEQYNKSEEQNGMTNLPKAKRIFRNQQLYDLRSFISVEDFRYRDFTKSKNVGKYAFRTTEDIEYNLIPKNRTSKRIPIVEFKNQNSSRDITSSVEETVLAENESRIIKHLEKFHPIGESKYSLKSPMSFMCIKQGYTRAVNADQSRDKYKRILEDLMQQSSDLSSFRKVTFEEGSGQSDVSEYLPNELSPEGSEEDASMSLKAEESMKTLVLRFTHKSSLDLEDPIPPRVDLSFDGKLLKIKASFNDQEQQANAGKVKRVSMVMDPKVLCSKQRDSKYRNTSLELCDNLEVTVNLSDDKSESTEDGMELMASFEAEDADRPRMFIYRNRGNEQ